MVYIVPILNEKGGVGKTTSVVEIAFQAGTRFGKRVLVVDLDPQANATLIVVS